MLRSRSLAALVCLAVGASLASTAPAGGVAGFGDVNAGRYYTAPVQWMVDENITTGTSPTCFSPDQTATRGQTAAFMWRMEGEPDAPPHPFVDVVAPWQQGPVSWMVDVGVTTGTTATTFSPNDPVTRGQVAALLHRLAGEPDAPAPVQFTDVVKPWQIAPVGWMLAEGITTGTSPTSFSPDSPATRAQIATFFHRYHGSPEVEIDPSSPACGGSAPAGLTVAFIGDQGYGAGARSVLELIRDEGADIVLHQGDYDYKDDPEAWEAMVNDVLGADFPYFGTIGNHDVAEWDGPSGYQVRLVDRLTRVPEATCTGEIGVKASCTFRGLFFILSGAGTKGSDHERYIANELATTTHRWRICTWHKNMKAMQVGGKTDDTGWGVYEACREGGAIIATGHEHSYSRTRTLVDMSDQTIDPAWPLANEVRVAPGSTFAFVSGLGGKSVRGQKRCLPATPPYGCDGTWASIYTSEQDATHGALFCAFGVDAQAEKATCWFKDIDGNVPDMFTVTNGN